MKLTKKQKQLNLIELITRLGNFLKMVHVDPQYNSKGILEGFELADNHHVNELYIDIKKNSVLIIDSRDKRSVIQNEKKYMILLGILHYTKFDFDWGYKSD